MNIYLIRTVSMTGSSSVISIRQYQEYCQLEGEKNIKTKSLFKKGLEDMKYKIANSSKDGNQVFVFNVKLNIN